MNQSRLLSLWLIMSLSWISLGLNPAYSATVNAVLDRSQMVLGETVQLQLTSTDQNSKTPDFSLLATDFEIVGTTENTQMQIINGQIDAQKTWELTLSPKRAGRLQIPVLTIGNATTLAIPLEVLAQPAPSSQPSDPQQPAADLWLEAKVDKTQVYVQGQVKYTLRLYLATRLLEGELSEPEVPQAIVQRLGQDAQFETTQHNRRYQVIERVYAVFPQTSGSLTIPGPTFKGRVPDPGATRQGWDPFARVRGKGVVKTAEAIALEVRPMPASASAQYWLPAEQVILTEEWSNPAMTLAVGEPLTRTLVISARGLSAAQLPELPLPTLNGLKFYADQPEIQTVTQGGFLVVKRQQKIAIQAAQAGTYTLPEIKLDWWDTLNDRAATARLPARTLTITAPANVQTSTAALSQPLTQPAPPVSLPETAHSGVANTAPPASAPIVVVQAGHWAWVSAVLAGLWAITLLLWWQSARRTPPAISSQATQTDSIVSLRSAHQALQRACQQSDWSRIQPQLLHWGQARWPQYPPRNLVELAERLDKVGRQAVLDLDAQRYAAQGKTAQDGAWDGNLFWQIAGASFTQTTPPEAKTGLLPELYPSSLPKAVR